jgi:Spy/CpxP family protein refolding chaperone
LTLDAVRKNVPHRARTLLQPVSLQDFQGIAVPRTFTKFATLLAVTLALSAATVHAQRGPGGSPGGSHAGSGSGSGSGSMMSAPPPRTDSTLEPRSRRQQLGLPGRWWDDKHVVHTISLRPDQQGKMDAIFEANRTQLFGAYSNLQREEQTLTDMSPADRKDETKVFASIDRVTQARAELEKDNAHILTQIRQELDPDQLARLDKEIASANR